MMKECVSLSSHGLLRVGGGPLLQLQSLVLRRTSQHFASIVPLGRRRRGEAAYRMHNLLFKVHGRRSMHNPPPTAMLGKVSGKIGDSVNTSDMSASLER